MSLKNVQLVRTGTHKGITGVMTLTADDLSSMAEAYADKLVDRPFIKIGHDDDNVFNQALSDGEPAYGWVENVTVGDGSADRPDTASLYGDLVGMPAKLEEVAPKAFRRRSVEIAHGVTSAAKRYRAVLTHLSLLGVKKPAVKGLDDVLALYSAMDGADSVSTLEIVDGLDAAQTSHLSELIDALSSVDTTLIPPAPATGRESGTNTDHDIKEKPVTIKKSDVEKALEQAGDEDVTALLNGLLGTTDTDTVDETVTDKDDDAIVDEILKSAASEGDTVTLSKETFTQLSEGAAAGVRAAGEVDKTRRDQIIRTALSEGRIAPAEQTVWREQLETAEDTTVTLLSALAPRFALSELGSDLGHQVGVTELGEADQEAFDEFANDTFGTSLGVKN